MLCDVAIEEDMKVIFNTVTGLAIKCLAVQFPKKILYLW